MKNIRYFFIEQGKLIPIEATDPLIQKVKWHKDETLKIEVWPFDLKIGPTSIPYQPKNKKHDAITHIIDILRAKRAKKDARPGQEFLLRLNQTSTPYTTQFTKRDDARNRAYLSSKFSTRREDGQKPPTQDDTPF